MVLAGLGSSVLSAQRTPFRVCADPDYLPFSNRAGQGFENKIAEAVAKALGQPLEYTWASTPWPRRLSASSWRRRSTRRSAMP